MNVISITCQLDQQSFGKLLIHGSIKHFKPSGWNGVPSDFFSKLYPFLKLINWKLNGKWAAERPLYLQYLKVVIGSSYTSTTSNLQIRYY